MKKYFLHVKNMKNSNSSVPSISSQERTPFTVMTSIGRNDDRLCSESGVANLGINNPQLPLNGEGFQGSGFCPPTTNCPRPRHSHTLPFLRSTCSFGDKIRGYS